MLDGRGGFQRPSCRGQEQGEGAAPRRNFVPPGGWAPQTPRPPAFWGAAPPRPLKRRSTPLCCNGRSLLFSLDRATCLGSCAKKRKKEGESEGVVWGEEQKFAISGGGGAHTREGWGSGVAGPGGSRYGRRLQCQARESGSANTW